ncbi:MAG: hypothetical protein V1672_04455 [Candidatus Diapherotrites archaeon]
MDLFSKNGLLVFGVFFIATMAMAFVLMDSYAQSNLTGQGIQTGFYPSSVPVEPPTKDCPTGIWNFCGTDGDTCAAYEETYGGDKAQVFIKCDGGNLIEQRYGFYKCNLNHRLMTLNPVSERCERSCGQYAKITVLEYCEGGCKSVDGVAACLEYGPCYGLEGYDGKSGMSLVDQARYLADIAVRTMTGDPGQQCQMYNIVWPVFLANPTELLKVVMLTEYNCDIVPDKLPADWKDPC